jgi:hypothetical protein
MATPIRMVPVLTTREEIEYFYKTWAESLKRPVKVPSEERRKEIRAYIRKCLDEQEEND